MGEGLFQLALEVALSRHKFFQLPHPLTFCLDLSVELLCRLFQARVLFFDGYVNLFHTFSLSRANIVGPVKVTRSAPQNAASIASLIKNPAPMGGGGGDMGGMGGMY